jgi:benzoylformate decarboxylase
MHLEKSRSTASTSSDSAYGFIMRIELNDVATTADEALSPPAQDTRTIAELLVMMLERAGVPFIFGNPGTTEIPLVRACEKATRLRYIVALSEIAAVPMADGFARATRSLGVVNLHVAPGLGNGMGGLYTANIARTPLLVLVGGQDRRFLHTQPILWGPLEKMAGAVTKEVIRLDWHYDAGARIRRAIRLALTPPFGPVALICPPDLLDERSSETAETVKAPSMGSLSNREAELYAEAIRKSVAPALVVAEDVFWNDATEAVERLATILGAPVYVAPYTAVLPVSSHSKWYAGYLLPNHKQIAARLARHDLLLFVGGRGMRTTLYSDADFPQTKLWIGNDSQVLPPDGEFNLAVVSNTRTALVGIADALGAEQPSKGVGEPVRGPVMPVPQPPVSGLHPSRAVASLLKAFPNALWFDESGLSTSDIRHWMQLPAGNYCINGSGGIGWGLPAAVGASIGQSRRQVVAVIGDGSALYASEAMWTAAHHNARMLLVLLANRRYATLNEAARRLAGGPMDAFTIEPPVLNFGGLAALYQWKYVQASSEADLEQFLKTLANGIEANTLVELQIDPSLRPVTADNHF